MPKAENFLSIKDKITIVTLLTNQVVEIEKTIEIVYEGEKDKAYHAISDLAGALQKSVESEGYFVQILEEYF